MKRFLLVLCCLLLSAGVAAASTIDYEGIITESNHTHHYVGDHFFITLTDNEDDGDWDAFYLTAFSHVQNDWYERYTEDLDYNSETGVWSAYQEDLRIWEFKLLAGQEWLFYDYEPSKSGMTFSASLSPVPEPATMALFGLGLLGLAGITRKKR